MAYVSTGWMFLVPLNIVFLITGMFLDGASAITRLSLREWVPGLIAFADQHYYFDDHRLYSAKLDRVAEVGIQMRFQAHFVPRGCATVHAIPPALF